MEIKSNLISHQEKNRGNREGICYFDFITKAGRLLPDTSRSWDVAFSMQHHGLPTRLLDWTENLATALHFAMKNAKTECCIWILDPFKLNSLSIGEALLYRAEDLDGTYEDFFITNEKKLPGDVVAISPLRHHPRVFGQRSGFTVHHNLDKALDDFQPDALKKIEIPNTSFMGGKQFLRLAGVSEYSLFPDLDGLSRELKQEHFS